MKRWKQVRNMKRPAPERNTLHERRFTHRRRFTPKSSESAMAAAALMHHAGEATAHGLIDGFEQ